VRRAEMIDRRGLLTVAVACCLTVPGAARVAAGEQKKPVRYDEQTMREPKVVHKVMPEYPEDAKKEGVEGTIVLDAVIAEDGHVRETSVQRGDDARLVEAARTAVGQWRYEPMRGEAGEPIEVLFTVTIRFALGDE
jgi:protein TonB